MSFLKYIKDFSMFSKDEVLSSLLEIQSNYVKNERINSIVEIFSVYDQMQSSFIDYINYLFIDEYILENYKSAVNIHYEKHLNEDYQEIKKRIGKEKFENHHIFNSQYIIKLSENKKITCSLLPFIFIKNKYVLDQKTIDNLSNEDKLVITHLFLSNQIKSNLNNTPYNTEESNFKNCQYFNNLVSIVIENEKKLKEIYQQDDVEFIDQFFKNSLILQIARYTDKKILQQLINNENQISICKKIFKIKNKEIDSVHFFSKMMTIIDPKILVKYATIKKQFSFFKYVGYQLEEATGNIFPEKYCGKKRKHPNRGANINIAEALEEHVQYVLEETKTFPIDREELIDWYLIIMSGKLVDIFKLMVKTYPLTEKEKMNEAIISSMKQISQNNMRWSDIYFKEELENNLNNTNLITSKPKI